MVVKINQEAVQTAQTGVQPTIVADKVDSAQSALRTALEVLNQEGAQYAGYHLHEAIELIFDALGIEAYSRLEEACTPQPAGLIFGKPCYLSERFTKLLEGYITISDACSEAMDAVTDALGGVKDISQHQDDELDRTIVQPMCDADNAILKLIEGHIYEAFSDRYMRAKESYTI